ncbi:MAG: glycosyltransferase [Actinophytocola sp.]|uniref:glycosyltransferase n=1 Tax=Actinophytocola sp. TaxID=1872138 RepID=UPI0013245EC1|nr:glycosyltransferase [Actinophytocola sp.]MPZ85840.1 glycosyltransferase [Actinophytocola sp.]
MSSYLVCSVPIHGHVTPLLEVARHLVGRGDRVRFLTGARYREKVEATGATFLPLPREAEYDDSDIDASFPGRVGRTGPAGIRYDLCTIFIAPAGAQLAAVDAAIEDEPVDAMLAETLFVAAAAMLSRPRAQRPRVVNLGIVPLATRHRDVAPMGLGIPPMRGPLGRVRNAVLTMTANRLVFAPVQRVSERVFLEATGRPPGGLVMDWPSRADAVVQFTVPGFEYPRPGMPDTVHLVGPMSRGVVSNLPVPSWWADLDGAHPIVHVTQGTVANRDYGQLIRPTIEGLAGDDVLVVVSTGGRDVSTLDFPLPPNVRVAPYLPYDKLLPRTDVMVSNGGYGGVHHAMEHGVPLVVAGKTEDKTEVNARVGWSGVGINLNTNRPDPVTLARAVREVLADPSYRTASARIGAEIARSPGLDGLVKVVAG